MKTVGQYEMMLSSRPTKIDVEVGVDAKPSVEISGTFIEMKILCKFPANALDSQIFTRINVAMLKFVFETLRWTGSRNRLEKCNIDKMCIVSTVVPIKSMEIATDVKTTLDTEPQEIKNEQQGSVN